MNIQSRYKQASKEARWSLWLTLLYVCGWCLCAYLPAGTPGPIGFPLWFELSCIYLPILFIVVAYWVIKIVFQDMDLEYKDTK
ncbi:YhdT family protein [Conservatibacter flavescens]|uniref:DUF997 domain-containing protein n=1 Tax=Conservatibacter flavescens TaxID=28161 RepID=A0A2M8S486_9PAST|nr:DUF997 family protein [Conservatibacter flavescens]PJG85937.1 hypothetical protein CVP05_03470 [Conservatibacter flavescens]